MTGLQFMAVIENIPPNIKKEREMCQEMFSYDFGDGNYLHASVLKYASYRGSLSKRSYPRSTTASLAVSVNWTHSLLFERRTLSLGYRRSSEIFVANALVSGEWYVQLGSYWETNDTGKRIEQALTIYRDFMQKFFTRFWEKGQYKPKTTGVLTFLVCGRMSSLLCAKHFWLRWLK